MVAFDLEKLPMLADMVVIIGQYRYIILLTRSLHGLENVPLNFGHKPLRERSGYFCTADATVSFAMQA